MLTINHGHDSIPGLPIQLPLEIMVWLGKGGEGGLVYLLMTLGSIGVKDHTVQGMDGHEVFHRGKVDHGHSLVYWLAELPSNIFILPWPFIFFQNIFFILF
jgi:hypothetical protein